MCGCAWTCVPIFAYLHFRFHVQWTASFQKVIWAIKLPSELHKKLLRYSPCMRRNTLETISIVYQNLWEEYVLLIIFFCFLHNNFVNDLPSSTILVNFFTMKWWRKWSSSLKSFKIGFKTSKPKTNKNIQHIEQKACNKKV